MTDSTLNWRTGAGYPSQQTSLRAWAWEFLRRNPDYRADWTDYQNKIAQIRTKYEAELKEELKEDLKEAEDDVQAVCVAFGRDDPLACVYGPPRLEGETRVEWLKRVEHGHAWPLFVSLAYKWGIRRFTDPALDSERALTRIGLWADRGLTDLTLTGIAEWHAPKVPIHHELTRILEFDLRWPLAPQLARAKEHLEHRQRYLWDHEILDEPPIERARPDKFAEYLRVLDALDELGVATASASSAMVETIGTALFPNNENASNQRNKKVASMIDTARHHRDRTYRHLAVYE